MKLLLFLLKASWQAVTLAALLGAASGVASMGLIAIIHRTLQAPQGATSTLAIAFAGLCVVVLVTRIVTQILLTRIAQHTISRIRMQLCRQILNAPLRKVEEIGEHRLLACLTGDVITIAFAANGIPVLCVNITILISGGIYLGMLSPVLMVCAVVVCVLGIASYQLSGRYANRFVRQGREAQDGLLKQIRVLTGGVKELKLHQKRRREFVEDVLAPADARVRDNQTKGFCLQAAAISWGRLIFFLAIGMLLFVWPKMQAIDQAALTGYVLVILYLMSPLERIMAWLPLFDLATISSRKITGLGFDLEDEQIPSPAALEVSHWERIELAGVTHTYHRQGEGHDFLLGPMDLALTPGEIVFVIGGNGSGKTTLAKLIAGLYFPEQGQVLWNGQPVTVERREAYRQLFAVVFDNAMVFESLLGLWSSDLDQRAREYLQQLELEHVVTVTDGAFSSTSLSRGQRKRLALLTVYLEDRPIYVFDEWAADQDPTFKRVFYERCLPELKQRGKTVVAITHDDRYFSLADRVVKLDEGRIVQLQHSEAQAELLAGKL